MSRKSTIEWTNSTWNPVTGCTKVSAGCDHCYAERLSERFRGVEGHPFESGFDLTLRPKRLEQPMQWRRPQLIFVNSMSDLFHKDIPTEYIERVFDTMERADWHVYQVLTKRSSLMRRFVQERYRGQAAPPHIWLGVSVENNAALTRLRHLQQTNASVRFVSFEPLLGPIGAVDLEDVHWVIAGGESGPGARPVRAEWVRALRDQCQAQRVAFFFKQWGGRTPKAGGNTLDGRQWLEYPEVEIGQQVRGLLEAVGAPADDANEPMVVGPWVQEKLEYLRKYLHAYTTILSKQQWLKGYFYIDAFAGPGTLKIRQQQTDDSTQKLLLEVSDHVGQDTGETEYISGSPRVALELENPFTDYIFIEIARKRLDQLERLKTNYGSPNRRIHLRKQDCNEYLRELLDKIQWTEWRGVIFLDPFGMQVPWDTIIEIGKTEAIEVFINFPVGMAIQRLLKRSGQFTSKEHNKLDQYFGTDEWYNLLYERAPDMFGENITKKQNSGDVLVKWYRERLKKVFRCVSTAREVRSTSGHPLYYLIFAGPNKTGARIAEDVLRQGARRIR